MGKAARSAVGTLTAAPRRRAAALEKEQNESSRTEHARAPAGGAAVGELDRAATQRPTRLLPSLFLLLPALAIASLCQV
jgi:hypothetical protein